MQIIYLVIGLIVLSFVGKLLKGRGSVFTPPSRIKLYAGTASGKHAKDLIARKRELDACGLKRIGTYRIDPLNAVCTAFSNDAESICAVVYHHNQVGCFVDVCVKNTAGKTFTATNAPSGGTLDQREGHVKVFDRTLTIAEMFEMAKERRPEGPYDTWTKDNFAQKFEQAYAEEMDWRTKRGGVTSDEVRRTAQASGKNYTEEQIQQATRTLQKNYAAERKEHV